MKNYTKKQFLTPQEIAEELKLNLVTIYGYIRAKKMVALKIGRSYRIESNDFDAFIERYKVR
jgi:excisionase family DNA binding protein